MKALDINIVINNDKLEENKDLLRQLFQEEEIIYVEEPVNMYDLLFLTGFFSSRSEARRNWKRTGKDIPNGFSHFTGIGKLNNQLAIWKPS